MWVLESINGLLLIFGTNQKQPRLVRKELEIHNDTFVVVQLPTVQLTVVDTCTNYTHWVPIFIIYTGLQYLFLSV